MLQVQSGFGLDEARSSVSRESFFFKNGQILDTENNSIFVRWGFKIPKVEGIFNVWFDPTTDTPHVEFDRTATFGDKALIGTLNNSSGVIQIIYVSDSSGNGTGSTIASQGITHVEYKTIINGAITVSVVPRVITELYVDSYGMINDTASLQIELNKVLMGTNDLDGMSVRIVYES